MKYLLLILILCSCNKEMIPFELPIPEYNIPYSQKDTTSVKDSVPTIVINNIILPPEEKEEKAFTEETLRLLIAEFFSTVATIIAVISVSDSNP